MTDLALTPQGHLHLATVEVDSTMAPEAAGRVQRAFDRGSGHGLLHLGAVEVGTSLPPAAAYWREFAARYVGAVCGLPEAGDGRALSTIDPPAADVLSAIASAAPPMTGAEYLTVEVLDELWRSLDTAFRAELSETRRSVQDFLAAKSPVWHMVGRVHFNLAENRLDTEAPFAFLATYTTQVSAQGRPQHVPLASNPLMSNSMFSTGSGLWGYCGGA
jgi:non-specific serine/threonine protein kinase